MGEMAAQAEEMERLKEAISSKAGPLKLAQTRLNMRTQKIRRSGIHQLNISSYRKIKLTNLDVS